ncbi:MAG: sterol desaturase family protein, partial [Silicimonas sp.]|nr:sterol desaturase family protein [Silicimonas sp.]
MDETTYGSRDAQGHWRPSKPLRIAPFWRFPPKLPEILAWLPGFFLPWNAFYALSALAYWAWIIPPV